MHFLVGNKNLQLREKSLSPGRREKEESLFANNVEFDEKKISIHEKNDSSVKHT